MKHLIRVYNTMVVHIVFYKEQAKCQSTPKVNMLCLLLLFLAFIHILIDNTVCVFYVLAKNMSSSTEFHTITNRNGPPKWKISEGA